MERKYLISFILSKRNAVHLEEKNPKQIEVHLQNSEFSGF